MNDFVLHTTFLPAVFSSIKTWKARDFRTSDWITFKQKTYFHLRTGHTVPHDHMTNSQIIMKAKHLNLFNFSGIIGKYSTQ